jgi:hypothetical protein
MAIGVKPQMSITFHPETNGQTERVNQTIEAFLRAFGILQMSIKVELLPTAEFTFNNSQTISSRYPLFYVNYGFYPNRGVTHPRIDTHPVSFHPDEHCMMAIHEDHGDTLENS